MAEDIKRKISIFINDKEVEDSLSGIGREIGRINRELKKTSDPAERRRLNKELQTTKKRYGEIKEEINETNVSLEEAKGHFGNLFSGLATGDIKQIQSGLQGISGNIKGMTKAALAFIATPIGIAITALAGIGIAAKKWFDFNVQVFETNKLVKELTNESGDAVDAIRIRAEVLRDTFEIDLNQSINSAKNLVNNFGISYDEAFDLIEKSAVRGKTKNEEFFATLEEYPVQFQKAGFSAKDFINIVNTGIDLSIYKDKLPDALKEFALSINEQTSAAKESMINAFGEQFTNRLFNNIKTGAITPKQALQEIAIEADKIGLNAQQSQQLTADLFRGAGEDAGGALKIFEAVNVALNGQQKPLTENQILTQKQLELNKELKGVYTQLFASGNSSFQNLIAKGKIFATETLLKILKGGINIYNWFVDLNNESGTFSAILSTLGKAATIPFKIIGSLLSNAVTAFKGLGSVIQGVFTLDWDKVKQGFKETVGAIPELVKEVKNTVTKDVEDIYNAFNGNNQAKKISLKDFIADEETEITNTGNGNQNNAVRGEVSAKFSELIEQKKKEALQEIEINLEKDLEILGNTEDAEKKKLKIREKYSKAKQKIDENETQLEKLTISQRIGHYSNMFGSISQLLGKNTKAGKAAAIAQATMNTYQGVTEVWSTKSALPEPFATISRIANTAIVLSSGLASVKSIKKTNTQGFYKGGFTGNKPIRYDSQDGVAFDTPNGPYHINEWVAPRIMVENPKYAANFSFLESERKRLMSGYFTGGLTNKNQNTTDNVVETNPLNTDLSMLSVMVAKNTQLLEILINEGVTAVMRDDLRNYKTIQKGLDDYANLKNKNIR